MSLLRNLKVRTKIFGIIGLAILFLLTIGISGFGIMSSLSHNARAMYEKKMVTNSLVEALLFGNSQMDSMQLELLLAKDQSIIQQIQQQITQTRDKNQATRKELESIELSPRAKEQYDKFIGLIPKNNEAKKKVDDLALQNLKEEAHKEYVNSFKPIRAEMIASLENVVKFNEEDAKAFYEESVQSSKTGITVIIVVTLLAVLLCSFLGFIVARMITRPVGDLQRWMAKAQDGDLTVTGSYHSNDEIGMLTSDFNKMITGLRSIVLKVGEEAQNLSASSEQLLASSEQSSELTNRVVVSIQEIAGGAEQQLRSTMESVRAIEEMAIGINRIAEFSGNVSERSVEAAKEAAQGNEAIQKAIVQIDVLRVSVADSSDVINKLGAKSQEVGQIVDAITDIAAQTNLLALNAAIEAARAGEHGLGFAVVADQVRKLAEQSRQSAERIAGIIRQIQTETQMAVMAMEKGNKEVEQSTVSVREAGEAFGNILTAVQEVAHQMQEVSASSEQMSAGSEQITASLQDMESIAQSAHAKTEHVASASEEQLIAMEEISAAVQALTKMAQELQDITLRFKI
ncbi:methyl-accepting chemotaxis protein [Paenibacillus ginsengarvi]|uniref:Methyl-accepting chemotaxis protein n=1 Tax=Paenibacillus ginsengarvi TaxID=400777 RepID=A0A3B0BDY9_9BACL|nr:HAMP domain-containing methyl-accepting chemotaxis protein [Paenibacillus ginsengarvi]RKN70641.1 methyl-accepting chemotaxis protein [Paenibacillus ginsengarvi]